MGHTEVQGGSDQPKHMDLRPKRRLIGAPVFWAALCVGQFQFFRIFLPDGVFQPCFVEILALLYGAGGQDPFSRGQVSGKYFIEIEPFFLFESSLIRFLNFGLGHLESLSAASFPLHLSFTSIRFTIPIIVINVNGVTHSQGRIKVVHNY